MKALTFLARRFVAGEEPHEAVAVGNFAVGKLLTSFGCISAKRFAKIHPVHQQFLVILVMQHSGCMRFGQFLSAGLYNSTNLPNTSVGS